MSENADFRLWSDDDDKDSLSVGGIHTLPLSPNDGRFDDIDDEDPMEGIEIPKHLLAQQVCSAGDSQVNIKMPSDKNKEGENLSHIVDKKGFSATSDLKFGNSFIGKPREKLEDEVDAQSIPQSKLKGSRAWNIFGGLLNKRESNSSPDSNSSRFRSLFSMPVTNMPHISAPVWGSPVRHDGEVSASQPRNCDDKGSLFGFMRKPRAEDTLPEGKFEQPVKVSKVEPDPLSSDPMQFLMRLRRGNGRYGRGYCKKITPLDFSTPKPEGHTRFVCVSDTHNEHGDVELPAGDVLLHCGDFSLAGTLKEVDDFNDWLGGIQFRHKIVIAGNHELSFDKKIMANVEDAKKQKRYVRFERYLKPIEEKDWQHISSRLSNCTYLEDSEVTINGIKIWGSPWQPEFGGWGFNATRGQNILEKWNKIPGDGVDILMTHGPPAGHGDRVMSGMSVGCVDLLNTIQLRVQPKYHLFGHIHEDSGMTTDQFTTYINCSSVNYHYEPVHKPFIFDLPNKE